MTLQALAIHQFEYRDQRLQCRAGAQMPAVSGLAEDLNRDLKLAFVGKAGKLHGQFAPDPGAAPLAAWLKDWQAGRQGFEALARRFAEQLQLQLAQAELAFDGYLLLLHEQLQAEEYLYLYLLQHEGGVYVDSGLALACSASLDVRGLRLGARIALHGWNDTPGEPYLTLLRARGDRALADAFGVALGFSEPVDQQAQTNEFLRLAARYSADLEQEQARSYRRKLTDFCLAQDKQCKAVAIADLSSALDEAQPSAFQAFVAREAPQAPAQFYADRQQLRQFVRISGRSDLLSLSFSSECLGQSIVYDAGSDTLVLRDIPAALKARLVKYLAGDS